MNYTKIILAGLITLSSTAFAMPTSEQTKKVEPLVVDLMRDDQAALKSGKKTRVEVAESAMSLADQAESEAAKLLLMKGAFNLYVRAGEFDKAIETLQSLQTAIPDIPPSNMANIIETSLRSVPRKNGGQLYRLLDETKTRMRYTNEAASLEKSVKKTPADRTLRLKLAEHYAYLGKWDLALENFVAAGGKVSVVAKSERDGEAAMEKIADFWWDYPTGKAEELAKGFRVHAAKLYEDAIAAGAVTGLNKVQAERRIEEAKELGDVALWGSDEKKAFNLDLGNGIKIEMLPCEPGSFDLEDVPMHQTCKVKITRIYWLSRVDVTIEQWHAIMGGSPILSQRQELTGGTKAPISRIEYSQMEEFCRRLSLRFRERIPRGYVFRIPTYAEWRYAAQANAKSGSEWFRAINEKVNLLQYGIQLSDIQKITNDSNLKCWHPLPTVDATIRTPNPWGFYGMLGNIERRIVLDSFDPGVQGAITHKGIDKNNCSSEIKCVFPKTAIDWFQWSASPNRHHLALKQMGDNKDEIGVGTIGWYGFPETSKMLAFRLCVGPDLVHEYAQKHTKQSGTTRSTTGARQIAQCAKVQLWDGGPYWADMNIGAKKPWECGYYFWWGDTIGYKRENDAWVASDGSSSGFKFGEAITPTYDRPLEILQNEGWITADNELGSKHDAAQAHWGGEWRLPTQQELEELKNRCDWKWTTMKGVNGYVICGRGAYASASIFLPAAGEGYGNALNDVDAKGQYWASVPNAGKFCSWRLELNSSDYVMGKGGRSYGRTVRPVQGFTKSAAKR